MALEFDDSEEDTEDKLSRAIDQEHFQAGKGFEVWGLGFKFQGLKFGVERVHRLGFGA